MTTITKPRTIADILAKHDPPPPQPERAATPLRWALVQEGTQDTAPVYELYAVCDDGQARWFVWGEHGWVVKG